MKRLLAIGALLFSIVLLSPFSALAGNPAAPIEPGDNIQDPGDPGTAWGGCGPADSNCYVTVSNENFANADLTFTGNRYHDADGFGLTFDNVDYFELFTATNDWTIAGYGAGGGSNYVKSWDGAQVEIKSGTTGVNDSRIQVGPGYLTLTPSAGVLNIGNLTNLSTQDRLLGQRASSGQVGYTTVGNGLTLSSGALGLGGTITSNTTITGGTNRTFDMDDITSYGFYVDNGTANSSFMRLNPASFYLQTNGSGGNTDLISQVAGGELSMDLTNFGNQSFASLEFDNSTSDTSSDILLTNLASNVYYNRVFMDTTGIEISTKTTSGGTYQGIKVDLAGEVGIGDTTPDYLLDVATTTADTNIFSLTDSDGECLHNPESGSETVSCSSDERLKDNIADAQSALSYFNEFRIREYDVIASGDRLTGVIAQEVLETHPELVAKDANGFYMVTMPNPWQIVKAIQELDAKVASIDHLQNGSNGLFASLREWFADATNGIQDFIVGRIRATDELCINDTCVDEGELKALLEQAGHSDDDDEPSPPEESSTEVPIEAPEEENSEGAPEEPAEEAGEVEGESEPATDAGEAVPEETKEAIDL